MLYFGVAQQHCAKNWYYIGPCSFDYTAHDANTNVNNNINISTNGNGDVNVNVNADNNNDDDDDMVTDVRQQPD